MLAQCRLITFRVSRRRREMYIGHARDARLNVCLSVRPSVAAFPHYCADSDVTWRNSIGVPPSCGLLSRFAIGALVTLLDGQRTNIAPSAKCQRVLVLAQWLVYYISRESLTMRNVLWSPASVCLSAATCLHYCTDPDVTWRSVTGCPLVANCWADLQSVHLFGCYDNI